MKDYTSDRKLVLLITTLFFIVDILLLTWDYSFDEKMQLYKQSLALRFVIKFLVFLFLRRSKWYWNLLYAIPYIGLWSALFYFFFGKKHTKSL